MDLKPDSSSSSEGGGDRGMNIGDRPSSSVLMENRRLSIPPVSRIPFQFILSITGRVEGAEIFGINDIYCKYSVVYGQDWELTGGMEEGISQITQKDSSGRFVWNFPLEMTFRSSNPQGWPQIVISIYGADFLGNHVVRGYASTHLPLSQGSFTKILPLFVPESSSFLQSLSSWILGRRPEFTDPKIVTQSHGRQLVRVNSSGQVSLKFEVILKDFSKLGYSTSANVYDDQSPPTSYLGTMTDANELTKETLQHILHGLKNQVEIKRSRTSETMEELKTWVEEHQKEDPLMFPVDKKSNPYNDSKCIII